MRRCWPAASASSDAPKQAPYGTVAVFEDLYGNLWDLVQFAGGGQAFSPPAARS